MGLYIGAMEGDKIVEEVDMKVDRYKAKETNVCWLRSFGVGWCLFF